MLTDAERDLLYDLLRTPSPTGYEAAGQRKWAAALRPHADRVESDAYGNVWATREGADPSAPSVMLEAHADEIGFVVKYVTDEGFIHVDRIGGTDHAVARGRRVTFLGSKGPVLGVVGVTAIHLRDRKGEEKAPEVHDLYVDIGAASREEVLARGLRVGTPAVYTDAVEALNERRLIGRALDNRLGGFVLAQVVARLAEGERPAATVHAVNAVLEEIGGHGARMVAYRLDPAVALVLDVTHATDSPGISKAQHGEVKLGGGPSITHGTVNRPMVVERLIEVAEQEGIPLQHESSSRYSGTDTDVIFLTKQGIPSALVSIPMRYMHSTVETVDLEDVAHAVRLMAAFVRSVKSDEAFRVQID